MDDDTVVGRRRLPTEKGSLVFFCFRDLTDHARELIEKGEMFGQAVRDGGIYWDALKVEYDALKAHADALAEALETEGGNDDLIALYRDFTKQEKP